MCSLEAECPTCGTRFVPGEYVARMVWVDRIQSYRRMLLTDPEWQRYLSTGRVVFER